MNRVSAPVAPPFRTTVSRLTASKFCSNVARSRPPSSSPNSFDHSLQVYLQTRSITAYKCLSKLARSRPPSASPNSLDHGLQVHLRTHSVTASKCISKLVRSQPPSQSPNLLDYGLQVHLQTRLIMALEFISNFTQSQWGEMLELEGRQPMMDIPPHLAWHPNGILVTERFWLEERRMRVRRYVTTLPRGSMISWKEWPRSEDGNDRVCISYNAIMSFYSGVSQIYTPCCWVHLHYSWIFICMYVCIYRDVDNTCRIIM